MSNENYYYIIIFTFIFLSRIYFKLNNVIIHIKIEEEVEHK